CEPARSPVTPVPIRRCATLASTWLGWLRAIGEDAFDSMVTRAATKLHKADRSQLMQCEAWVVGFEVDDQLTHRNRQGAMMIGALCLRGAIEAHYAFAIKRIVRPSECTDGYTNLLRPFLGGR